MREAHVFLLPSVGKRGGGSETQGIVVQEAQLHGVPVIASAIGGLPESLDYGSAGILVEPGNVEEMTDAVRMLSERRDSTDRMVERAHRYVMGKYLRQAVVSQHLHLYNQLVA
jgi:glycosyltransferase involved in cell wall biosynthesis